MLPSRPKTGCNEPLIDQGNLRSFMSIFRMMRSRLFFKKHFFKLKFNLKRRDPIQEGNIFPFYQQREWDLKRFTNLPTFTKELRLDPRRAPGSQEPQHRWEERLTWVIRDAAEGMTSEPDKVWDKEGQISRVTGMNEIRGKMSHGVHPGLEVNRRGETTVLSRWSCGKGLRCLCGSSVQAHERPAAQLALAFTALFLKQTTTRADAWKPSLRGKQDHVSKLNTMHNKNS